MSASELDIAERIAVLHAQGLKPRDISAMLNVHPQIVMRTLGLCERTGVPRSFCTCVDCGRIAV
jgi:transposase